MRRHLLKFIFFFLITIQAFYSQLSGTYTIGSGGSYPTISSAITDLNTNGVSGPVVFNILNGTYNEQLVIGPISGTNNTNTVTFQSESLNSGSVEISYNSPGGSNYILKIDGANHLVFNELTFRALNTLSGRAIFSDNPKGNLTFTENVFDGGSVSSSGYLVELEASISDENLDNIIFSNNLFTSNASGLMLKGFSGSKSPNLQVTENLFLTEFRGMFISNFDAPFVSLNTIINNGAEYGMYFLNIINDLMVTFNKITSTSNSSIGVILSGISASSSNPAMIYNNMIQTGMEGIRVSSSDYINFYFNSVNIENSPLTSATSSECYSNNASSNINLFNNILSNFREGLSFNAGNSSSSQIAGNDYNNFFSNGTNLIRWSGTDYSLFMTYTSSSGRDINSVNRNPYFTTYSDLHSNTSFLDDEGTPIASITNDIDGDLRDATNPSIGADEFSVIPISGTFTIGSGGDFSTIFEALIELEKKGINGPIIFKLLNGTYEEQLNLTPVNGSSSSNPITFRSFSGNSSDVTIKYSANNSNDNFIVRVDELSFVTFADLTFEALGYLYARIIYSINPRGDLTFLRNIFKGKVNAFSNYQTLVDLEANIPVENLDNLIFNFNTFQDGFDGLVIRGNTNYNTTNISIAGNSFNTYRSALRIGFSENPQIISNTMTTAGNDYTIFLQYIDNGLTFQSNKVSTIGNTSKGVYLFGCSGTINNYGSIANNFIQASDFGINMLNSDFLNIYFNTVNIEDSPLTTSSSSSSFYFSSSISGHINNNVANNIFSNKRQGYAYNINTSNSNQFVLSDYNNLIAENGIVGRWNNTDYNTLAALQTATGSNQNSYSSEIEFVSISDLHISGYDLVLNGMALSTHPVDIDGDVRNNPPFIGADEPGLTGINLSLTALLEGPYASGTLNTALYGSIPKAQPYSLPIHDGNESVTEQFLIDHTEIVDWVVVQLRSIISTRSASRAGFLLKDGSIVGLDGSTDIAFEGLFLGNYYIAIFHRNHLPIISSSTIIIN